MIGEIRLEMQRLHQKVFASLQHHHRNSEVFPHGYLSVDSIKSL
jgi:hypothetical protein